MSYAQQALYRICQAAGIDQVRAAHDRLSESPNRDLKFLTMRAVLAVYLRETAK